MRKDETKDNDSRTSMRVISRILVDALPVTKERNNKRYTRRRKQHFCNPSFFILLKIYCDCVVTHLTYMLVSHFYVRFTLLKRITLHSLGPTILIERLERIKFTPYYARINQRGNFNILLSSIPFCSSYISSWLLPRNAADLLWCDAHRTFAGEMTKPVKLKILRALDGRAAELRGCWGAAVGTTPGLYRSWNRRIQKSCFFFLLHFLVHALVFRQPSFMFLNRCNAIEQQLLV